MCIIQFDLKQQQLILNKSKTDTLRSFQDLHVPSSVSDRITLRRANSDDSERCLSTFT